MNEMTWLLTECCKQTVSALDGMLCCTCFWLQCWCAIEHGMQSPAPQIDQYPAPLARSLAKIERTAPELSAQEPALLSLCTLVTSETMMPTCLQRAAEEDSHYMLC